MWREAGPSRASRATIYAIDIRDGGVVSLGQLPQAVEQAVLVPSGTSLYLLGGKTANGKASTTVIRIDPATGNPTAVGKTTVPLVGAAAVSAGSRSLVDRRALGHGLSSHVIGELSGSARERVHVLVRRVHAVLVAAHPLPSLGLGGVFRCAPAAGSPSRGA